MMEESDNHGVRVTVIVVSGDDQLRIHTHKFTHRAGKLTK
jgi:hypothetical protein